MINDYFYIVFIAVLVLIITCLLAAYSKAIGEKEAYRARVFELTNGEEGSNLVKVKPDHYPPPPPPKDDTTDSPNTSDDD
jgi:NADH:ubiquinone oxidoreductase subunit 3 (subunit A)